MKHYTIGILFNKSLTEVVLIQKNRPEWQKGRYNFPGGHIEQNESPIDCVRREFQEECNITIQDWKPIGCIINDGNYEVHIFTAICGYPQKLKSLTDEPVVWTKANKLRQLYT